MCHDKGTLMLYYERKLWYIVYIVSNKGVEDARITFVRDVNGK